MKSAKQGPFQESFYHQPAPIRAVPRGANNRGRGSRGGSAIRAKGRRG